MKPTFWIRVSSAMKAAVDGYRYPERRAQQQGQIQEPQELTRQIHNLQLALEEGLSSIPKSFCRASAAVRESGSDETEH